MILLPLQGMSINQFRKGGEKMIEAINRQMIRLYATLQSTFCTVRDEEEGMEVMQVVLLLGAGLVVIAALIAIGSRITTTVDTKTTDVLQSIS